MTAAPSQTHQPKGSMCMSCSNGSAACAELPFSTMPVVQAYPDGVKAVKCSEHQPTRAERDRPAALRANDEARNLWWQAQADQVRQCIRCGMDVPDVLPEGEGSPYGCP